MLMRISFSNHALWQLKERNLTRIQIIAAIRSSGKVTKQAENRFRAVKKLQKLRKKNLLVVVYDRYNSNIEIVTAFITSKINKYL